jgi:hypothetical protein
VRCGKSVVRVLQKKRKKERSSYVADRSFSLLYKYRIEVVIISGIEEDSLLGGERSNQEPQQSSLSRFHKQEGFAKFSKLSKLVFFPWLTF